MVTDTRGSRRMLRVFWYSARWAETSSSPSGVDSKATHTTVACGLPSGFNVTSVASMPSPMNSRAASLSLMRCSTAERAVSFPAGLQLEQRGLGRSTPDVLAHRPVGADHTVTRDHHGQRVVTAGGADGANGAGAADGGGHLGVALAPAVADVAKMGDDAATEAVGEPEIDGQLEAGAPLGEVLVELTSGGVQPSRCAKHTRTHGVGEGRQHSIVVFDVVGHADQPDCGGCQQQGADRA